MGGLSSGPGPGITLLIAIVLALAQTALSAPLYEEDEGQENNAQSLAESHGCYYNFQHYNEGERILTNEPCLNCTCRNRMLMCYLRVCPFTKGIGQNCTVEKVPGQCCPIITCPEVPVQLLTSTTTEGIKAPGGHHVKGTEVGHLDTNGCNIDGIFYPNGAQVPGSPEKPCELCYCIRNKTACIMQECALHVDGCRPVYEEGQCFPIRYQCDDSPYEEEPTTTIRPAPTPGLIITTTSAEPLECAYNGEVYEDGSRIQTEDPCEHCYCLKGKIACAVQECGAPLEKEGQNCTALPPASGKCCPDSYQCDVTMTSQGLNYGSEGTTEAGIPSVADAGHPTDGYHPDQGIRTTEKPSHASNPLDHITETVTPSKGVGEQQLTKTKPQELDKGTQNELIESHLPGLHPMKPVSTDDDNQKITFPVDNNEDIKRPGIMITPEIGRPETTHIKENESSDPTIHVYDDHIIDTSKKRPHPESVSHILGVSTKKPETAKPVEHSEGAVVKHPDDVQPTYSFGQTSYNMTTNNILNLKPQIPTSDTKDPLLDKLHNIIQDVQAQVSDGKTTEMPEQVDYQTTMQSQTGHFTDKPEILSHLPQLGSQTSSSGLVEMGSTVNKTSPDDSNDIINKLQGIIQGIYSHVDPTTSAKTPESSTMAGETQSNISVGSSEIIRPGGAFESEKEDLKPHKGSEYPVKPIEAHWPHETETTGEAEVEDKHSTKLTAEKSPPKIDDHSITMGTVDEIGGTQYPGVSGRPQDSKYSTEMSSGFHDVKYPEETSVTGLSGDSSSKHSEKLAGMTPEGSVKLPLQPKPEGSYDEPYGAKHPDTTNIAEEEVLSTEYPHATGTPDLNKYSQETNFEKIKPEGGADDPEGSGISKRPFNKEKYPGEHKPDQELPGVTNGSHSQSHYPAEFLPSEKHPGYPDGNRPMAQYPEEIKPSSLYPEANETTEKNLEEISPTAQYSGQIRPQIQYPDKTKPTGFIDAVSGTEYPESVTDKLDSGTKYPVSMHPLGQYPEKLTSGQSNAVKPTESEEFSPGQQYPDGSRPTEQYPDGVVPSGQHVEEHKPAGQHVEEHKPAGQYPEKYKPNQHSTGLKPGQQYPEGSKPTGYYPEKTKPDIPTNASFQISYSEDITGKPDDKSKHPEDIGFVPTGQHPEKIKPTEQFSNGSEQSTGTKPLESDGISFEYPEGVTNKPGSDNKYTESSKYSNKTGQEEPESSGSESPFGVKFTESNAVTSKPGDMSKYPEGLQTADEHLVPEKPTGSKPYGTEYPEEAEATDLPDTFSKVPEVFKPGKPGTTDQSEHSIKYSQENKPEPGPDGIQHHEVTEFTKTFETSTKHFESEKFKPDEQSKYPEGFRPGQKPSGNYPEDSKYPEITGITDRPEDQTSYIDSFVPTTRYPEYSVPDEYPTGSKNPLDKNKPHSSTESEDMPTENPTGTGVYSRPKPESNMKPSEIQYPEITNRPDISHDTDLLVHLSKYPEKTKPEETPYEAEHGKEVTGKPDDESKYSEDGKPVGAYPDDSKVPVTGKPEDSKRPYSSEHLESSEITDKPEEESKYPEGFRPTPGSEYVETTEFFYGHSTYIYSDKNPSTQKTDFAGHLNDIKPTQQYSEGSEISGPQEHPKHPQKQGVENKPYSNESPDSTERPDEHYTEHPNYNSATKKPDHDDGHHVFEYPGNVIKKPTTETLYSEKQKMKDKLSAEEYQTDVTGKPDSPYESTEKDNTAGRPQVDNKYSQKPGTEVSNVTNQTHEGYKPAISQRPVVPEQQPQNKPESENELYDTSHTERPKVPDVLDSEDKLYGTEYPEGVTGKPADSSKYPDEKKEQTKRPEKPESEYLHEDSAKRPDEENSEQNMTMKPQGFDKYPEETYAAQHTEKIKPPSEDQLLETDTKPEGLDKYSEETKPVTKPVEVDKLVDGTEYPEKFKPSSGSDLMTHPPNFNKSDISAHPEQPGKPLGTYGSLESITKSPHYTVQYPHKPSDGLSGSEYSEEMDKLQYSTESEYLEKIKPMKYPEKPESGDLLYSTEYPEKARPDEAVYTNHTEEIVTDKPQDLNKHPVKSKPESLNKEKDQVKYPITSAFEKEPFGSSATNKPDDKQKYPENLKHPIETKPGTEHLLVEVSGTDKPFVIKVPEEGVSKPEDLYQEPEKHTPTDTEKLGMTYRPNEGLESPQNPVDGTFDTENPNLETETGRPEDFSKYPDESKPTGQKGTEYPKLPEKPEYESKYPEGLTQTGQHTQKPYGSHIFPSSEYPDDKVTGRPEHHTKFPEGNEVEHYPGLTERPQYPEGEKLHDSELLYGTESPVDTLEYHTKYPDKFMPMDIHSKVGSKPHQSSKYPGGSMQYPEETTDRIDDYIKYPENVTDFPDDRTKRPELGLTETSEGLTKHPADIKPAGIYHGRPQVSEENPNLSTEYPDTGETDRPNLGTKYSEKDKAHVTEYPANFGTAHEQSATEYIEGSKSTDSLYSTEHTNLSGLSNEYTHKFKPGHGKPHPESLTEHTDEGKPTETYYHESERPVQEETFENGVTVSPDAVTKYSDNMKPVGSETTVHGMEFFEKTTDKSENIKYSEGLKHPDETETEYPEINTGEPIKENIYPEEFKPTAEYPHSSIKYTPRPKPELENKPYDTQHPETVSTPEEPIGFTRYPHESSTTKHPQRPELEETTVFGLPDDLSEYPHGFTPGSENYSEKLGVNNNRPQGSTNYPQKKPLLEDEPSGNQYSHQISQSESSTRFPDSKKPEGIETLGTVITNKPEKSKYPENSEYSEITTPVVKHSQRPKPAGLYDTPYGTAYPETTDSEYDGVTETSEYLGQHPSAQYPQRTKPSESEEKLHGTENSNVADVTGPAEGTSLFPGINKSPIEYPLNSKPVLEDVPYDEEYAEGIGSTEKPDDENKYFDKTGYLTSRPFPERPKPIGSDQAVLTEYPEASKPDISAQTYASTKFPEAVEEQEVTGRPIETEEGGTPGKLPVLHSQETKKPQETTSPDISGTEEYPSKFKPVGEHLEPSEKPYVQSKYPTRPKPSGSDGDPHGAGYEDELSSTQYPKETENIVRPEGEKYPENAKITAKPHGIQGYPLKPKPTGFEDEPLSTEYLETTEELDETSTVQGQVAFGKNPIKLKPVTKHPEELYVSGKPVEPSKHPDKIKPEGDQFFSTELPEEEKPEGYEPSKYPVSSHRPDSVFENIPYGTEYPNSATTGPNNENKYSEEFKPSEKHPSESGVPDNSIKYPETHIESGKKPYSTEYPEMTEVTKHPEGFEPQKSEDEVISTELFGVTRKPVSSFGVPTDGISTEFSTVKPGISYLPQGGELSNEKIPSSEHLNESSTPVVSEYSSSTEINLDNTHPTVGSPAEGNLLNTFHDFGSHQDKPSLVDLTHEQESSSPGQDLIIKYPEHTTISSDLYESDQFSTKPTDEAKPTEFEINAVHNYSERPKPTVPGEGSQKVQDPNAGFVESSSFPSTIFDVKKPEILSGPEVAGTKKPDDEHQLSEVEGTQYPSQYFSTVAPGIHKYSHPTRHSTSDMKHQEGISTVKPGDYYPTSEKHKTTTLKQPNDVNLESTDHPANENTHLEEAFTTESAVEHVTYENYPEGTSLPAEGFTRRPTQGSISFVESSTETSQDVYLSEKVSTGAFTGSQKTTTPSDNDLINKLHNIISGIQSQVTDGKTTKQPHEGYELTSFSVLPTKIPQDYYMFTDKFGRPAQKPQEFTKFPHDQTSESSTTPSGHLIDGTFSSENEIYDQTTTDLEETENQTDTPQFGYTSVSGNTDNSVFMTPKGPEGIRPTEMDDNFSTKYPHQEIATGFPVNLVGKPESTEFPELEKPEFPIKGAVTSHPDQSSPISKHPTDELLVTEKHKPEISTSDELPGKPTKSEDKYPEATTAQFSHKSSASVSASSQYPENISTTASSIVSFEDSGKPDLQEENQVMSETPTKTGNTTTKYPYTQDQTTQIYQEVKGNQAPIENVDNLIAENNKTAPNNEDLVQGMVPKDVTQKHPISVPTDKPLHVVYPTYYPDGVVSRTTASKPDGETDKKVTVTPQSTVHEDTTIKSTESSLTSASKFEIYEAHTEISNGFTTTSPVVIIQEVHTEVHSERAPIKTDAGDFVQQTTRRTGDSESELNKGKPHDQRPEHGFEKFTKQPELTSQTPQIIFGQPAIIQPAGNQSTPETQTFQPHAGLPETEKFSTHSTHAEYPAKQPEPSTKPGFVTVTPVGIAAVTKDFENIMHLYSSRDKHSTSTSSIKYSESFTTASPIYSEEIKHTTKKGETAGLLEIQTNFVTDQGVGTTHAPEILGTRFPSRKTTQKPTDGVLETEEGTPVTSTQGIGEEYEIPHTLHPGVSKQPSLDILTEGLPTADETSEVTEFTTTEEEVTRRPQGVSFVPYKLINGNKVYYPQKESPERPIPESSPFDGYDRIPYEIVNGTKFFYPNRVVTLRPEASQPTTTSKPMGMYVPYKIVNGSKIYYTQDKPQKPEKFDGLDYVPFDIINGTKVFYPERVTTTPSPSSAMYVPFKIIDGTKVYYPKEAQEEPQNIPDEYDGFDYVPYSIVNGNKIFRPDHIPGHLPATTDHLLAMYVPYKLLNGNRIYYPKDAQTKPEFVPEEYDGFDLVPYEVVNGTKLFYPDPATTQAPEQVTVKTSAMYVPYKVINGTKVYFPKYAQSKPTYTPEGYDGFDYLPYEEVNNTKVFHLERATPKPEFTSTPAFYSSGMFVPYKIINNTKVFFPKDAQHKPRPLKPGYDGVHYLSYDVINGTKVFYPEKVTTPTPIVPSAMYVPYKIINGTKVYYADKATDNPEKIPEGYEGFDYVPYEIVNGNKVFYPDRLTPTTGMYVPFKKVNGSKVYYPKDSSEKRQPIPESYDGADFVPYEIINGTKVFYPDRVTTSEPTPIMQGPYKIVNGTPSEDVTQRPSPAHLQGMFIPYKMINGTKVYYPQEAHKRPHPLSDEYAGLDYIPYEVVNGTKVFHPERLTPSAVPAMYVPYKLINGTKVFYPKHAQHSPQQILSDYDGFDYIPYEIINGSQVFYPNRVPNYQGMYVPYKVINGEKVFYPKYAQHKPPEALDGYDGFDYLPYENVNGTNVIKPIETITETPFEQAMYVPYKVVNGTKVFYAEHAQYKPYLIPQGFDGFDYIPYEIVNGTKVFDPDLVVTPSSPFKSAMYVPFKIINGKKVYYSKDARIKPHLVPEGYDGFDYIPYEVVNGTKIFDLEQAVSSGPDFKPGLYVPYKIINGIKVYQPKYAQNKPSHLSQDYDGFDYLSYDIVNGNKVFYPEQPIPLKQAMYVPFKYVNGTKVFYPKYAQHVPIQTPENYDGLEYIPYEIVKGDKVFHPEQAVATETPFKKAMYVPYKVQNGTKIYYPKNSHFSPNLIPQGYDGFDYIPYEVVNGNKVFYPEQAIKSETSFKQALYVPFRIINKTKVYYPKQAQPKPQLIPENYDGFDYLPYKVVNGTKIFDPQVPSRPTYLQGMYVPYKSVNNTKVFYPKDAHNKPNYTPEGYDGADYVPYEPLNNTKMFYPELISTAQPNNQGSAGVYVPFKVVNNKKVFYPKEATPFPPTVRYPYDGVAFVPYKVLGETSLSEIVYVDDNETFKPHKPPLQPGQVPGEGSCYINNRTFANNTVIPPVNPCQSSCICVSSVVRCVRVKCPSPPENKLDCSPVYREGSCCATYVCGDSNYEPSTTTTKVPEFAGSSSSGQGIDATTPFVGYGTQKRPYESEDVSGVKKPEVQSPSEEYHLHKPPRPKPEHESLEPYDSVEGQLTPEEDYDVEDEEPYGPGTCRYAGKVYVSAQQIPRDDPCDFCFCFRSDIICLQQSCPPPIPGCRDEPIQGFCCPRYECHVKMATVVNVTSTTTTTTTTTLPPHFFPHAFKGSATKTGCFVQGKAYRVGQAIPSASGPCMDCICGGNGRMKCEPKVCTPEPMIRKMISPSENVTSPSNER